jgi:hypothetical protein
MSIDFIKGLPKVGGKSVILTVVSRFSKYAHFIPLGTPTQRRPSPAPSSTASSAYTGSLLPSSATRTGNVWRNLFGMAGIKLRMSTVSHP